MRDGDWLIGWGCASAVYPTHVGAATARVRLQANGEAHVQIAAHEIGVGVGLPHVDLEVGDGLRGSRRQGAQQADPGVTHDLTRAPSGQQ